MQEKDMKETKATKRTPLLELYIQNVILEEHRAFEEEMMEVGPISILKGELADTNNLH